MVQSMLSMIRIEYVKNVEYEWCGLWNMPSMIGIEYVKNVE